MVGGITLLIMTALLLAVHRRRVGMPRRALREGIIVECPTDTPRMMISAVGLLLRGERQCRCALVIPSSYLFYFVLAGGLLAGAAVASVITVGWHATAVRCNHDSILGSPEHGGLCTLLYSVHHHVSIDQDVDRRRALGGLCFPLIMKTCRHTQVSCVSVGSQAIDPPVTSRESPTRVLDLDFIIMN